MLQSWTLYLRTKKNAQRLDSVSRHIHQLVLEDVDDIRGIAPHVIQKQACAILYTPFSLQNTLQICKTQRESILLEHMLANLYCQDSVSLMDSVGSQLENGINIRVGQ